MSASAESPSPLIERRQNTMERLHSVLTVDELAVLLRVNRKTIYEAVQKGLIPGATRLGTAIRFSKEAIRDWLRGGGLSQRGPR